MVDESSFFLFYAAICVALAVTYVKVSSAEGVTVTTGEFKLFQRGFLTAHAAIFLGELLSLASFYPTFIVLDGDVEHVTKLYICYVMSNTACGVLLDIVDFGSRKDKCVLSAVLYIISLFTLFLDDHYDMLLLGRVVYGAACAVHHSAFQNYVDYQHEVMGFPDDWLTYTYSVMTHSMALMAGASGLVGYFAVSSGSLGTTGACTLIFTLTAVYMGLVWEQDQATPRFMWAGFLFNLRKTVEATRSKKTMLYILGISASFESAITIFTFYWAPWMTGLVVVRDQAQHRIVPYELIYASMVMATMFGNYMYGMHAPTIGPELSFQAVLICCSVTFLLSATVYSPVLAFFMAISVQLAVGGYWPSIGALRGRFIAHEQRSTSVNLARICTMALTSFVLFWVHDSPMLILSMCALLCGVAAYLQHEMVTMHTLEGSDFDEHEKDDL